MCAVVVCPSVYRAIGVGGPVGPISKFSDRPLGTTVPIFFRGTSGVSVGVGYRMGPDGGPPVVFNVGGVPHGDITPLGFYIAGGTETGPAEFAGAATRARGDTMGGGTYAGRSSLMGVSVGF